MAFSSADRSAVWRADCSDYAMAENLDAQKVEPMAVLTAVKLAVELAESTETWWADLKEPSPAVLRAVLKVATVVVKTAVETAGTRAVWKASVLVDWKAVCSVERGVGARAGMWAVWLETLRAVRWGDSSVAMWVWITVGETAVLKVVRKAGWTADW
jgi:hypothetical protein